MYLRFLPIFVLSLAAAAPVEGQSRPERPYRGLFGGGEKDWQGLSVFGTAGGGYSTDLRADAQSGSLDPATLPERGGGALTQFAANLSYSLSTPGASFSASGGTTGRYYPGVATERLHHREHAGVQGSLRIPGGFSVMAQATYSPFRVWDVYAPEFAATASETSAAFDFGTSTAHYLAYGASLSGGWRLSRRLSAGVSYGYGSLTTSANVPQQSTQAGGGNLAYNIGRGLDLTFGYTYTEAQYGDVEPYSSHGFNGGVNFSRALSVSRRTTLSFGTGTAASNDPSAEESGLQYHAVGNVSLNHQIGRTWTASVGYGRTLRFSEYWPQPLLSDSVTATLEGLISRRLQAHARAGAATGRSSLNDDDNSGFDSHFGDAGLTFALNRYIGLGTSYRYYRQRFGADFGIVPSMPPFWDGHSVQAFVTMWAPIFQHARRP